MRYISIMQALFIYLRKVVSKDIFRDSYLTGLQTNRHLCKPQLKSALYNVHSGSLYIRTHRISNPIPYPIGAIYHRFSLMNVPPIKPVIHSTEQRSEISLILCFARSVLLNGKPQPLSGGNGRLDGMRTLRELHAGPAV